MYSTVTQPAASGAATRSTPMKMLCPYTLLITKQVNIVENCRPKFVARRCSRFRRLHKEPNDPFVRALAHACPRNDRDPPILRVPINGIQGNLEGFTFPKLCKLKFFPVKRWIDEERNARFLPSALIFPPFSFVSLSLSLSLFLPLPFPVKNPTYTSMLVGLS